MDNKVTIYSFFYCPNLLDFSLLSLHQVLAGREEPSDRGDSSGAREKLPRCLEGKAEVWTLPRLFSISKDVRWEEMKGVEGWQDGKTREHEWNRLGEKGPASSRDLTPSSSGSFLISISYAMSPPLFPRLSGNLSPSLSGTLLPAEAPRETTDKSQPFVSHWEKLFSRQLPRKKWLSVVRMRMRGAISPPRTSSSSPSRTQSLLP